MKFVYLLKTESGTYKIGVSKNPSNRVKQLNTGNSEKINLIYVYETDIAYVLEKSLKNHFSAHRLNGEWFNLSIDDELNFKHTCNLINERLKHLIEEENPFLLKK